MPFTLIPTQFAILGEHTVHKFALEDIGGCYDALRQCWFFHERQRPSVLALMQEIETGQEARQETGSVGAATTGLDHPVPSPESPIGTPQPDVAPVTVSPPALPRLDTPTTPPVPTRPLIRPQYIPSICYSPTQDNLLAELAATPSLTAHFGGDPARVWQFIYSIHANEASLPDSVIRLQYRVDQATINDIRRLDFVPVFIRLCAEYF